MKTHQDDQLAKASGARKPLNILWIMTDQQPLSTIGAYGNRLIETPHIDRLAREGVRFDRMIVSAFPCSPSRGCFMTGREAHNHGVVTNDVLLPPDIPTLGSILKGAGYNTAHVGKWHLGGHMYRQLPKCVQDEQQVFDGGWHLDRVLHPDRYEFQRREGGTGDDCPTHGFDHWRGGWKQYRDWLRGQGRGEWVDTSAVGGHNMLQTAGDDCHACAGVPEELHVETFIANEAVSFLESQRDAEEPFALVVSFYGPHLPVAPPEPWDTRYPLKGIPLPENHHDDLTGKPSRQRRPQVYKSGDWAADQFRDYIRRYWGFCSYIDAQIGRIRATLEAIGEDKDTLILFTSDHGDMVAAHGMIYKLACCGYDELFHVPFILRCPGQGAPGTTCDSLTAGTDILPTVLDLLNVSTDAPMDGHSFGPLLNGAQDDARDMVICNSIEHNFVAVTPRWKYVLNLPDDCVHELYDLENDPGEMLNLAQDPAHQATATDMQERVLYWAEATGHPYAHTLRAAAEPA